MTQEQYEKSIKTGHLQLSFGQKISFFGLVILFLFLPIMVLIYHLIDRLKHNPSSFSEQEYYIFFISIVLGGIVYWYQKERLKFIHIKTNLNNNEVIRQMNLLCEKLKWTIDFQGEKVFIAISNISYFSGSLGEQITVIIDGFDILVNSINNPNIKGSLTFLAINRKNVKAVTDMIENADN